MDLATDESSGPNLKYLKAKCLRTMTMKVLSHTNWGVDHAVLLRLYQSLIHSKLDCGSIEYGSARKSHLFFWLSLPFHLELPEED